VTPPAAAERLLSNLVGDSPSAPYIVGDLREEYAGAPLTEDSVAASPLDQFRQWFDEALRLELPMANGMTLATCDASGRPAARIVLLKGFDDRGFVFYTHYESRKAGDLEQTRRAALLFWWIPMQRQIRIEGVVSRVSPAESDDYFATRPRDSNLSAMASPQSQVIASRGWLEERVSGLRDRWDGRALRRPDGWGGYRVAPDTMEFWQGRPNRLHDRIRYRRAQATARAGEPLDGGWQIERLAP